MTYQAPIRDILFNIESLSSWSQVCALPRYDDIDAGDARAALEEFGRFCGDVIAPLTREGDEAGAKFNGETVELPSSFATAYSQFVDMGWQSLAHPPEFGGMGLPHAVGAAATEILNAADMSFGLCPLLTNGAIDALLVCGSEDQKNQYLENLITGKWTGTMNLTEPQAGSDLGRVRTKATPADDGSYAISGTKIFITYGEHELSENIIHLVLARTPDAPAGPKGLSLFIVPKFLLDENGAPGTRNGVNCVSVEHKLGVKASPTAILDYDKAKGFLIGEENKGLSYMFVMMTAARFAVGVQGVAISERAYQHALRYANERVQSRPVDGSAKDAVAIIEHPDVRRMLMQMRAFTEGGRALSLATAGWLDLAHNGAEDQRADADAMAEFLVPLVKGWCTERALEVTSLGVQIHGGMGFIEETGVAQLYRDARILPIYEGTTAIQANDLLGRKILRDGGKTASRFAAMIKATEDDLRALGDTEIAIADALTNARRDFDDCLAFILETAPTDPNAVFAGGVPFLMMVGNLAVGWQMGRAVLAAKAAIADDIDTPFMTQKIATASYFAHHVLVESPSLRARVKNGATSLLAATF
ncbi:MAG: acyl-CoA dehydrogenase [Halocynthiibacter sp.]